MQFLYDLKLLERNKTNGEAVAAIKVCQHSNIRKNQTAMQAAAHTELTNIFLIVYHLNITETLFITTLFHIWIKLKIMMHTIPLQMNF
jgi:hypothetical protein